MYIRALDSKTPTSNLHHIPAATWSAVAAICITLVTAAPALTHASPVSITVESVPFQGNQSVSPAGMPGGMSNIHRPVPGSTLRMVCAVSTDYAFMSDYLCLGATAALVQANQEGVPGVDARLEMIVYSMKTTDVDPAPLAALVANPLNNVLTFVANAGVTRVLTETVSVMLGIPDVAPQSLAPPSALPLAISMRASSQAEFTALLNMAFHGSSTYCASAVVMAVATPEQMEPIHAMVRQLGFDDYTIISRPLTFRPEDFYNLAKVFAALSNPRNKCVFLTDLRLFVEAVVSTVAAAGFDMTQIHWFVGSGAMMSEIPPEKVALFQNFYVTQVAPPPRGDDLNLQRAFRRAMDDPELESAFFGQVNRSLVRPTRNHTHAAFEGYIGARLALAALQKTTNVTRENFIKSFYDSRMLLLDDFSVGPFTRPPCPAGMPKGALPCKCNVGLKSLYLTRVNGTTGRFDAMVDRPELGEVDLSLLSIPLAVCEDLKASLRRVVRILAVYPASAAAATALYGSGYVYDADAIAAAINEYSAELLSINTDPSSALTLAVQLVPRAISATTAAAATAELEALIYRYVPYVALGAPFVTDPPYAPANATARVLPTLHRIQAADLSTRGSDVDLFATLHDYLYATGELAATYWGAAAIGVVADTQPLLDLGVGALHTFQLAPSRAVHGATASAVAAAVGGLARGEAIVVAASKAETVEAALRAAAALAASSSGVVEGDGATLRTVFIAADEAHLTDAYEAVSGSGGARVVFPAGVEVLFASMFGEWWAPGGAFALTTPNETFYSHAASRALIADRQRATGRMSGRRLRPFFLARALHAAASAAARRNSTMLETLYEQASVAPTGMGVSVGPFLNSKCSSLAVRASRSRNCECSKGPRRFFVHRLDDWAAGVSGRKYAKAAAATPNATSPSGGAAAAAGAATAAGSSGMSAGYFAMLITTCGVQYIALRDNSQTLSPAILALIGVAAGVFAIVLAALAAFIFYMCCIKENHRNAPKDQDKPFACCFTDIQSSTALWARAPSAMPVALELHHEILRSCIKANRGYEVKTIGDSFMVTFKTASAAAQFAIQAQRALHEATWPREIDDVYDDIAREIAEQEGAEEASGGSVEDFDFFGGVGGSGPFSHASGPNEPPSGGSAPAHAGGLTANADTIEVQSLNARFESSINSAGELPNSPVGPNANNSNFGADPLNAKRVQSTYSTATGGALPEAGAGGGGGREVASSRNGNATATQLQREKSHAESVHQRAAQRKLFNGIRVRIGMNFGFGEPKQDPVSGRYDYYGTVVNCSARVEACGHGGQVLCTRDFCDAIEAEHHALAAEAEGHAESLRAEVADLQHMIEMQAIPLEMSRLMMRPGAVAGIPLLPPASHILRVLGHKTVVFPLGPQPLRGLSEPVELFSIVLDEHRARVYPPLRLDVEVDDIATRSNAGKTDADSIDSYFTTVSNGTRNSISQTPMSRHGSQSTPDGGGGQTLVVPDVAGAAGPVNSVNPQSDAVGLTAFAARLPGNPRRGSRPVPGPNAPNAPPGVKNGISTVLPKPVDDFERRAWVDFTRRSARRGPDQLKTPLTVVAAQYKLLRSLFGPLTVQRRREFLEHIAGRWRVALPKAQLLQDRAKEHKVDKPEEHAVNYALIRVLIRVSATLNVGLAVAGGAGGRRGSKASRMSRRSSNASQMLPTLTSAVAADKPPSGPAEGRGNFSPSNTDSHLLPPARPAKAATTLTAREDSSPLHLGGPESVSE